MSVICEAAQAFQSKLDVPSLGDEVAMNKTLSLFAFRSWVNLQ